MLESPTLYTQNYIPDLGEASSQLPACFIDQTSHQSVDLSRFLHTESAQSKQRLHHEHTAYYFVYTFSIPSLLLEVPVNYRLNNLRPQIPRISL